VLPRISLLTRPAARPSSFFGCLQCGTGCDACQHRPSRWPTALYTIDSGLQLDCRPPSNHNKIDRIRGPRPPTAGTFNNYLTVTLYSCNSRLVVIARARYESTRSFTFFTSIRDAYEECRSGSNVLLFFKRRYKTVVPGWCPLRHTSSM
jgi:hypothetical protein